MSAESSIMAAIELMNADKSLAQPWKNYAISDARRALALLKMADASIHTSNRESPSDAARNGQEGNVAGETMDFMSCICPDPVNDKAPNCPVHGF